jgi:hypothetical protein
MSAPAVRLRVCLDCRRPYDDTENDALCSECRAANTARNMVPGVCACGNAIAPGKYRSSRCPECERAHLRENVRKWGSE